MRIGLGRIKSFKPKRIVRVLAPGLLIAAHACGAAAQSSDSSDGTVSFRFNPEARWVTWDSHYTTTGQEVSSGSQFYVPFGGSMIMRNDAMKLNLTARSGYVDTRHEVTDRDGKKTIAQFRTQTDTAVSATVTIFGIPGIQPYVSVASNIPTGATILSKEERPAVVDSDIVQVAGYGQGRNVAPTFGVNIPVNENLAFSVAYGENKRHAYKRLSPTTPLLEELVTIDPGDTETLDGGLSFEMGPLSFWFNASRTREASMYFNEIEYYRTGRGVSLSGGLGYTWNSNWYSSIDISKMDWARNRVWDPVELKFLPEEFNSNNELTTVRVETTYSNGAFSLTPAFGYTLRQNNDWDPVREEFVPTKTIVTAGVSAKYDLGDNASITGRIERSWLHEFDHPQQIFPGSEIPPIDSDVWLYSFGGAVKF